MRRSMLAWALLAALLAGCGGGSDDGGTDPASDQPVAPEGTTYVGASDLVIAIPSDWTLGDARCPYPSKAGSYVLGSGVVPDQQPSELATYIDENCGYAGLDEVPSDFLRIIPGAGASFDASGLGTTESTRDGFSVGFTTACQDSICRATWAVAEPDVLFSVEVSKASGGKRVIAAMDTTLRLLPSGWSTSETDGTVVPAG